MRSSAIVQLMIIACLINVGCAQRSFIVVNETNSPLFIEAAIRYQPYRIFSEDQFYRLQLNPGDRWDSRRAISEERVEWWAAEPLWVGVLIRELGAPVDDAQRFSLGVFKRAVLTLGGTWPDISVAAVDRGGEAIKIARH